MYAAELEAELEAEVEAKVETEVRSKRKKARRKKSSTARKEDKERENLTRKTYKKTKRIAVLCCVGLEKERSFSLIEVWDH